MAKQQFEVVKLQFSVPLHLSRGQTDSYDKTERVLHSDTIKSALFAVGRMLYGEGADEAFWNSFLVSSAFPYSGDVYFFPKPMAKLGLQFENIDSKTEASKANKKIKKLEYLAQDVFESVIAGEENIQITDKQIGQGGIFIFPSGQEASKVFTTYEQQRLAKPENEGEDGTPYYIDRLYFAKNCGLYFFLKINDENYRKKIQAAVKLLGDEGIGTDKHVGNGQFTPDFGKIVQLNVPEKADAQMLLSLYLPEKGEYTQGLLEKSAYMLTKRGGYIASPANPSFLTFRKKSVYMFTEASVFPSDMPIDGKKINLEPQNVQGLHHEIWREGKAFTIPVQIIKENDGTN